MENENIDYSQWGPAFTDYSTGELYESSFWGDILSLIMVGIVWLISAALIVVAAAAFIAGFAYLVCMFLYILAGQPKV